MNSSDKPEKTGLSVPEHRDQMASNLSNGSPGFHVSAWSARWERRGRPSPHPDLPYRDFNRVHSSQWRITNSTYFRLTSTLKWTI